MKFIDYIKPIKSRIKLSGIIGSLLFILFAVIPVPIAILGAVIGFGSVKLGNLIINAVGPLVNAHTFLYNLFPNTLQSARFGNLIIVLGIIGILSAISFIVLSVISITAKKK